jgi:hypothetical protein
MSREQRGSVLLVTVGLLAVLVTLTLAFLARMRSDAEMGSSIVAQAQSRWMLQAALCYLQETSRLGWAPSNAVPSSSDAESATLVETCGWTDIRDGSLGPRPLRLRPGTPQPWWWGAGASWPAYNSDNPPTPPPTWWTNLTPYRLNASDWDAANSDTYLPALRSWPCPGSVLRVEAYAFELPPYAVRPATTLNPINATGNYWTVPVAGQDGAWMSSAGLNWYNACGTPTCTTVWGRSGGAPVTGTGLGALDPQPVKSDWTDFAAGEPGIDPLSRSGGWFRIYRELKADHDNDGNPWYDRVPLRGYSAFLIAAGSGGSRGFRFFSNGDPGWNANIEPTTADSVFPDRATFELARRGEIVQWFRVEWSGWTGGVFDGWWTYRGNPTINLQNGLDSGLADRNTPYALQNVNPFGHFPWIQRLAQEPEAW